MQNVQALDRLLFVSITASDDKITRLFADTESLIHDATSGSSTPGSLRTRSSDLVSRLHSDLASPYASPIGSLIDNYASFSSTLFSPSSTSMQLAADLRTLLSDLVLDSQGKPTFKPKLAKDMMRLLPVLARKIGYLPLPRVEVENEDYKVVLDNVVVRVGFASDASDCKGVSR